MGKRFFIPPVLMALLWATAVLVTGPGGNFPLNDDWSYGEIVRRLTEEGRLAYTHWVSMALITQVLWGALFTFLAGFSFTALRLSTLVLALAAGWGLYGALRESGGRRGLAFFGAICFLFNPVFYNLAFTFMTDVPFCAFFILALYGYVRALRKADGGVLIGALGATLAAVGIREVALLLPLAFMPAWFWRYRWKGKSLLWAAVLLVVPFAFHFAFRVFLESRGGLPAAYDIPRSLFVQSLQKPPGEVLGQTLRFSWMAILYLGLFMLPLAPRLGVQLCQSWKKTLLWAGILGALGVGWLLFERPRLPQLGNILYDWGLGPTTLPDTMALGHNAVLPRGPALFWKGLSALSLLSGAALLAWAALEIIEAVRGFFRKHQGGAIRFGQSRRLFALAGFGLTLAPFALNYKCFDRYYLPVLPFALMLLMGRRPGKMLPSFQWVCRAFMIVFLLGFMVFSIAGTHDYLAWNRLRWQVISELEKGPDFTYEQLEGGFEVYGWKIFIHRDPWPLNPVLWHTDGRWALSFGPMKAYRPVKEFGWSSWLRGGKKMPLLLQEKRSPSP